MNQKELQNLAKYHINMAKSMSKLHDHHIKAANNYLRQVEKLQFAVNIDISKIETSKIIEALKK